MGGYVAAAEAAWMGVPQATEFLDQPAVVPDAARPPQRRLGFLNREFGIAAAAVVLMGSFLTSAMLGAIRQILFNHQFGAGTDASAYYAAFRLPDTLFSLIAGGALSSALIPVLLSTRREEGEEDAQRLTSLVLNVLLLAILLITAVAELTAPLFVRHVLVPGYASGTQDLAIRLTRIMLLQPIILVAGSVAIAVLNSRNQFLLTALSVASHNLALIAGIVATATDPRLGIYGPTLGVIAGAVLQVLIVLPGVIGSGARYHPAWNLSDPRLREVLHLLVPNGVAVGVAYTGFIVDTAFASGASDAASLAAIQNAWLLVGLPIALLGQAIGQGAFPRLAAHAAAGEYRELRRTLVRALLIVGGLALGAIAGTLVLGRPVIRVLFEHGEFTAHDGALTAQVLVLYAIGLPAYVATELLVRALIALRDARTQLITNSGQVALRIALVALLLHALQVKAIPVALVVAASSETAVLLTIALRRLARLQTGPFVNAAPA